MIEKNKWNFKERTKRKANEESTGMKKEGEKEAKKKKERNGYSLGGRGLSRNNAL